MYKVISFRGADLRKSLTININEEEFSFPIDVPGIRDFNARLVFQFDGDHTFDKEHLFGKKIAEQKNFYTGSIDTIGIGKMGTIPDRISMPLPANNFNTISCTIFADVPVHQYDVLAAIPLPVNILTVLFEVSDLSDISDPENYAAAKYFDAFSHLGFCLTDLDQLKDVMCIAYPDGKDVDLVEAFAQTELIDTLFEKGIIIVTWGFNPYTYPIYSVENDPGLMEIFGERYDAKPDGVYRLSQLVSELSIIPGNELRSWNKLKAKPWPKIPAFGKGERVILQPRKLTDYYNGETTIASFVLYREEGSVPETTPLLNMDLLYS